MTNESVNISSFVTANVAIVLVFVDENFRLFLQKIGKVDIYFDFF